MVESVKGKSFSYWTIKSEIYYKGKNRIVKCSCKCGTEREVNYSNLVRGKTKSCGCYYKMPDEQKRENDPLYKVYLGIRRRCYNKNEKAYERYGGRGIIMCDDWFQDFLAFKKWAEKSYKPGLWIERIDVNGNYEPSNCKWATIKEQANNKRNNIVVMYKGKRKTVAQWCEILDLDAKLIYYRLDRGMSFREAIEAKSRIVKGLPEDFNEIAKRRRTELRLTQKQIADFVGVNQSVVSNWEVKGHPSRKYIYKYLDILDLNELAERIK